MATSVSLVLVKAYVKFYFQTKRFYALAIVLLLVVLLEPLLILGGVLQKPETSEGLLSTPVGLYPNLATLVAALLAGDAISQDFSRQGLFTMSQPLGRPRIMLSRYASALITSGGLAVFFFLVSAAIDFAFYGEIVPGYAAVVGYGLLYVAALVAFVMFFSSLFKSPSVAIGLAAILVIVGMPIVQSLLILTSFEPWFLVTYAGGVVSNLLSQPYPPHVQTLDLGGGIRLSIFTPTPVEAAGIMGLYLVASLAVSLVIYNRRELKEI